MQTLFDRETVTSANIEAIRARLATDQARSVAVGHVVSVIRGSYPAPMGSTIMIEHNSGRAAVVTNGDADWGDYAGERITLDATDADGGPIVLGLDGEVIDAAVERVRLRRTAERE